MLCGLWWIYPNLSFLLSTVCLKINTQFPINCTRGGLGQKIGPTPSDPSAHRDSARYARWPVHPLNCTQFLIKLIGKWLALKTNVPRSRDLIARLSRKSFCGLFRGQGTRLQCPISPNSSLGSPNQRSTRKNSAPYQWLVCPESPAWELSKTVFGSSLRLSVPALQSRKS